MVVSTCEIKFRYRYAIRMALLESGDLSNVGSDGCPLQVQVLISKTKSTSCESDAVYHRQSHLLDP